MNYKVKVAKSLKNLSLFSGLNYSVYKGFKKIGEFHRNYFLHGKATFAPFQREGKWYALYSPDYTTIRCMDLEDGCKDLGGIEPNEFGICPIEIIVPVYSTHKFSEGYFRMYYLDIPKKQEFAYSKYAITQGCVWGDDSTYKLTVYDISQAHKGIIKPVTYWSNENEKEYPTYFGLHSGSLKDIVEIHEHDPIDSFDADENLDIQFATINTFRINPGSPNELFDH